MASLLVRFKEQKIINIKNVTSICYSNDKLRIIFNLNYSITLPHTKQLISDYVYWEAESKSEYNEMVDVIKPHISRWFESPSNMAQKRFINPEFVSSIVFDIKDSFYKVIFNLSHTVSMKNSSDLTSEYVYFKFNDIKEFSRYKGNIICCI